MSRYLELAKQALTEHRVVKPQGDAEIVTVRLSDIKPGDRIEVMRPGDPPRTRTNDINDINDKIPCPTCGIPADVAEVARKKLVLDAALQACEAHLARCATCKGWGGPYCPAMERLRESYYQAWAAYYGQPEGAWRP